LIWRLSVFVSEFYLFWHLLVPEADREVLKMLPDICSPLQRSTLSHTATHVASMATHAMTSALLGAANIWQ
jgi:hypothetical protein